jgi:phage baseplate assembly protein V
MLNPVLSRLSRKVASVISRGRVSLVNNGKEDSHGVQKVQLQLLAGESKDAVEAQWPYGFHAHPHPGAEAVVQFFGGRDHAIVSNIGDRRFRPAGALQPGDVQLHNDQDGTTVTLTRDQTIVIKAKSIKLECEDLTIDASSSIVITSPSIDFNK